MHPFTLCRPVDIAWRDLRLGDKGHAFIAKISKTQCVPRCLFGWFARLDQRCQIVRDGRYHAFDHETGFGNTNRHWRWADWRDGDAHPDREYVGKGWATLMLIDQHKATRVGQPGDSKNCGNTAKRWEHHREFERQCLGCCDRSVGRDLVNMHDTGFEGGRPRIGYPFDMTFAHFAFHHRFGVAHAIEAKMSDIGFGCHKGHWHAVADFSAS